VVAAGDRADVRVAADRGRARARGLGHRVRGITAGASARALTPREGPGNSTRALALKGSRDMAVKEPKETPMIRSRSILFALVIAAGVPACVVSGTGTVGVSATPVVVYNEPPPEQVEHVTVRPGHVWVKGRWDWRNGQWVWIDGRWEAERSGRVWSQGRWERRGNQWHWIEGTWVETSSGGGGGGVTVTTTHTHTHTETHHGHGHGQGGGVVVRDHRDGGGQGGGVVVRDHRDGGGGGGVTVTTTDPMYPTAAPPPVRTESYAPRAGFVWISGRWDWNNGQWVWVPGHWERARAAEVWIPGRWQLQGNYYVWIEGRWSRR
jgi:hypothetical protein